MYSCKAAVTQCWCIAGEFRKPMGITSHSYSPRGVVTAVRYTSSGCTLVWKNELVMSIALQILPWVLVYHPQGEVGESLLLYLN